MKSLLPTGKLALKRVESSIKRIYSSNGIILLGVDSKNLADEFVEYFTQKYNLKTFNYEEELLSKLAYDENYDKNDFFLANIFENKNQKNIIDHLQFQRDFIPQSNIKIVVILSNESLEYLKIEAGDLFSTVKFSHSFVDYSVHNDFEEKHDKLDIAIQNYEKYLLEDVQHDNILFDLTFTIGMEAYNISNYELSLQYLKKALFDAYTINQKMAVYSALGGIYNNIAEYSKSINYSNKILKIAKKHKIKKTQSTALNNLANSYNYLNKFDVAIKYYNDSLKINQDIGDKSGIATSLENIGKIYKKLKKYNSCFEYFNKALKISKNHKLIHIEAVILKDMAEVYREQNNLQDAKTNFILSRRLYEAMNLDAKVKEINKEIENLG